MAIVYRRLGAVDAFHQPDEKIKYSPDLSLNPQSKNKFREINEECKNIMHEEATPESLGITFPYPEYFRDSKGEYWKRFDFSFNNEFTLNKNRDRQLGNVDHGNTFKPFVQDTKSTRNGDFRGVYTMGSALSEYKKRGSL